MVQHHHEHDSREGKCPESVVNLLSQALAFALADRSSIKFYADCLRRFPLRVVETAFREATVLPDSQVRKNRGAYFNFLVKRFSSEDESVNSDT